MSGWDGPLESDKGGNKPDTGKTDFQGGGQVDRYAVVPSPNKGQYRVQDVRTREDVTLDHSKEEAQKIADRYQNEPNPMRHEPNVQDGDWGGPVGE